MQLPTSNSTISATPLTTTPDTTASFYAISLHTKTSTTHNGHDHFCPNDAYLAARVLSLKGEHKRAIWILDQVGLIGFGMDSGDTAGSGLSGILGEGDVGGGVAGQAEFGNQKNHSANYNSNTHMPAISNEEGIHNAIILYADSANW